MVKTTAQTLQAFGTELAETELPNDGEATTNLLHTHSLKKDKMKVRDAFFVYSCQPTICPSVFPSLLSLVESFKTVFKALEIYLVNRRG